MRIASVPVTLIALAALLSPRHAAAQHRGPAPAVTIAAFDVTPYAGYMLFGDFVSGPLGSSIANAPAPVIGLQAGMKLTPELSLTANLATASSDIKAGIPFLGGVSLAQSRVVMYDAGLQLDLPLTTMSGTELSPFLQAGVGAMRYDITQSFLSTTSTNLAGNVGVGADIGIGSGVGLRLLARDYIGRFDVQEAMGVGYSPNLTHNVAMSVGVRFTF